MASHDYRKLDSVLKAAEKLQQHNAKLFKIIERTEKRLLAAAKQVANQSHEVNHA